jgi:hypothetical protein
MRVGVRAARGGGGAAILAWLTTATTARSITHTSGGFLGSGSARLGLSQKRWPAVPLLGFLIRFKAIDAR